MVNRGSRSQIDGRKWQERMSSEGLRRGNKKFKFDGRERKREKLGLGFQKNSAQFWGKEHCPRSC